MKAISVSAGTALVLLVVAACCLTPVGAFGQVAPAPLPDDLYQVEIEVIVADLAVDFSDSLGFIYTFKENDTRIEDDFRVGNTNILLPASDTAVGSPLSHPFNGLDVQGRIMEVDFGVFSARLQAAVGRGKGELLARPRILALNNVAASIHTGESYPYLSRKIGGNSVVLTSDYIPTGVSMTVTPTIAWNDPGSEDDYITLNLDVKVDFVSRFLYDSGLAQPIVATRDYRGFVTIKDNHTIGIGGLYREDVSKSKTSIPGVGSIPVFGNLFTSRNEGESKSELVIFVTARIDRNIEYEIRSVQAAKEPAVLQAQPPAVPPAVSPEVPPAVPPTQQGGQ